MSKEYSEGPTVDSRANKNRRLKSILQSTYKKPAAKPSTVQSGPVYLVDDESFVLNQTYLSEHPDEVWSKVNPNGVVPVVVHPELVKGKNGMKLSDDQRSGVQFLWNRYEIQAGGILAHEMGLGKTRTCITVIATLLQQSSLSRGGSSAAINKTIIIAPKNGVAVWKDEFDKWCPDEICKVVTLLPAQKNGWDVVKDFRANSFYNVLILSYETFKKYISTFDDGFALYEKGSVGLVVCDEAHRLKNEGTQLVKSLKQFGAAKLWIGITGTPYQNNLDELCNLVEFFCNTLTDRDLKKDFCKPINKDLRTNQKLRDTQHLLVALRSLIRPAIHYKENSFNIERHEVTLFIALDGHPDYYKAGDEGTVMVEEQVQHEMYKLISQSLINTKTITFNEKLSYLVKACIHPQEAYKALQKHPNVFREAIQCFENKFSQDEDISEDPHLKYGLQTFSAKVRVTTLMVQHIRETKPDEKVIIVSGSTVLLKNIEVFWKTLDIKSVTYDGEKSFSEREKAVDIFENEDNVPVLLLSLKAGATALTLTRANHIIMLEPDYNPANDRQAFGRIYRPGQNRKTFIYRLVCTGTLEEVKLIRQLEKEAMGKAMKAEDDEVDCNLVALYCDQELLQYFPDTRSNLNDKLDEIQITEFNDDMDEGSRFVEEIKNSKKYRDVYEVPDELNVLKKIWGGVSYCFHMHKSTDPLTQYLLNDEYEIVDGNIRLNSPI